MYTLLSPLGVRTNSAPVKSTPVTLNRSVWLTLDFTSGGGSGMAHFLIIVFIH